MCTTLHSIFPLHRPVSPALSDFSCAGLTRDPLTEAMIKVNPNAHTWFDSQKMGTLRSMVVEKSDVAEIVSTSPDRQRLDLLFIGAYPHDSIVEEEIKEHAKEEIKEQAKEEESDQDGLDVSSNFS